MLQGSILDRQRNRKRISVLFRIPGCLFFIGLILAGVAILSSGPALAGEKTVVYRINVCPYLASFKDPGGRLTFREILHPDMQARFVEIHSHTLNDGLTRSVHWYRLDLRKLPHAFFKSLIKPAPEMAPVLELDRAWMPVLDLWVPVDAGKSGAGIEWRHLNAVTADKSAVLPVPSRSSVFLLPKDIDSSRPLFLKIASSGPPLNFPLYLSPMRGFCRHTVRDFFIFGILYGLLGAMILYNAFLFFSLRSRVYLFYVLYMIGTLFYQASTFGQLATLMAVDPRPFFPFIYALSGMTLFFAAWFCRAFLLTRRNTPLFDKMLVGYMILAGIFALLGSAGFYLQAQFVGGISGLLFPFTAIAAGIVCLRKGIKPARYFLMAWSVLAAGILIWSLRAIGLLAQSEFTTYSLPAATALEAILLSLALADRIRILQMEKKRLETRERRLLFLSNTDGLTKLYNKRYFDQRLNNEINMAESLGHPLTLLLMDLDNFKKINDTHGHQAGDRALEHLAGIAIRSARDNDCACRYGGEEFALILPGADSAEARHVAERIRVALARQAFSNEKGQAFSVTVSIGLAQYQPGDAAKTLIGRADRALYRAKEQGKNRTVG